MAKLLSSLPVGALVKDTNTKYYGKSIIWQVLEHGHSGDPSGSTALMAQKILCLKAFDAKEPSNSNSDRKNYGNNRYLYSNIKQWLNSDATSWYSAQHSADHSPDSSTTYVYENPYTTEQGFLKNFSANLKNALMTVSKKTAKNTVTDGGSYENVSGKVFLLSNTEVGLTNENSIAEGSIYSLFNTSSNRQAYPTAEAVSNSTYTSSSFTTSKPWYWWLRSPYSGNSGIARIVYTDGSLNYTGAYNGNYGVRPAFCVSSSILVSDSTDSDGAYVIQWNAAPQITTASTELGDKNAPFGVDFKITDADGDTVTATVKRDSTVVTTINPVDQTKTYTHSITGEIFNALSIGRHTITITATDSFGNVSEKVIGFNRVASQITISGADRDEGNKWFKPTYTYTVADSAGHDVTVTEYVDDVQVASIIKAQSKGTITFTLTDEKFDSLTIGAKHTLKIKGTNTDGGETYRYIYFTKILDKLKFTTKAVETDAAAKRIVVNLHYDTTGAPGVKVEVCNNAKAASGSQVWEDATTAVLSKKAFTFTNNPTSGYGVAVRVTISKNANTPTVTCTGLGFCFD